MPTIRLQGIDLAYDEADIITFDEGLIGLPHLRRMVLAHNTDIAPFHWLVALDTEMEAAFLVANPHELFPDYPSLDKVAEMIERTTSSSHNGSASEATNVTAPLMLAIATIQPDWAKSTINLRAPIVVTAREMRGHQLILPDTAYKHDEPLARHATA